MITRVTQTTLFRDLRTSLTRIRVQIADAQETVSTQKRLREPSDDPIGAAQANRLRGDVSALGALREGIGFGVAVLGAEDDALGQAEAILTRAREIATQQASGLSTSTERQQAGQEVADLERSLLALGNTTIAGRHVFGGLATGPAPFAGLDDPGFDATAAYSGPADPFSIRTGSAETVRLTTPGDQVLGSAITALDDLRTTLAAGNAPVASLAALDDASATLGAERASVGAREARLDARTTEIGASLDGAQKLLGATEDADLTQSISELVQLQNTLQATLAAGTTLQTSILDFLRP